MRFGFSEQQLAFGLSARKVFANAFPGQADLIGEPTAASRKALADAGLLGIMAPESAGGLELALCDAVPVVMEAAAAGTPFPISESIIAARLLASADPIAAMRIVEGTDLAAFADMTHLALSHDAAGAMSVSGRLEDVNWGDLAKSLIGPAGTGEDAILLAVDLARAAVTPGTSFDRGATVASLSLTGAPALRLGGTSPREVNIWRSVLSAAELYGLSRTCFEKSVEYAQTRQQFGHAIGQFQAVKHLLADCAVRVESMLVSIQYAAWAVDKNLWDGEIAALAARTYCSDAARKVCEDAIQIHGGIGFTWDYGLHFHLRRALRLATIPDTNGRDRLSAAILHHVAQGDGVHY